MMVLSLGMAVLMAVIRGVFPVPQPPNMPTGNGGWLSLMIVARPWPISRYPSAGDRVGESSKIFIVGTRPTGVGMADMSAPSLPGRSHPLHGNGRGTARAVVAAIAGSRQRRTGSGRSGPVRPDQ